MEFIGVGSVFIVALTGVFSGMVLALQTTYSLRAFGAEGVVGQVVAVSLTREIAPVFAALMVAARAGSAMAAELGNMRITEQIDALVTMAVSPVQYLLSPRLLAAVLTVPLLCILYSCVGMARRVAGRGALARASTRAFSSPTSSTICCPAISSWA